MKLSLIIPLYNVEKYIEKCLLSCLKQNISFNDYEIIVVNDGSTDNSLAIAKRIANNYLNIKIISQDNQGLSMARNNGFSYAQGDYIWFIDSDDYIEENCLGRIGTLLQQNLDILQLQYRCVYEDGRPPKDESIYRIDGIKTGLEIIKTGGLPIPAQFSIYRSEFLRKYNLFFLRGVYHEDCEFKPRVTYLAQKIASDSVVCYNYLQRKSGSITANFKLKNGLDLLKVNNSLLHFTKLYVPFYNRRYIYSQISLNMNTLLFSYKFLSEIDKSQLLLRLKENKHLFFCMLKSNILKYQLEGIIFCFNLKLGLLLHRLIR